MQFMYHLERNRFLFIALSTVFIQYLVNQEHMLWLFGIKKEMLLKPRKL